MIALDGPGPGPDAGDAGDAAIPSGPLVAYASGYSATIDLYGVDASTGALTLRASTPSFGTSPSFLAINRAATHLYAVDENTTGRVGAYSIDPTGALTFLNAVSSGGERTAVRGARPERGVRPRGQLHGR